LADGSYGRKAQGLKPRNLLAAFRGTTEVVPCYKTTIQRGIQEVLELVLCHEAGSYSRSSTGIHGEG